MPPSCCWFFWAWWLPLMLAVGAAGQGCSGLARRCGNLTISDPFWVVNSKTGRSCGSRDFVITCLNNIPLLPSTIPLSDGFQIMDISYEEDRIHVVDLDKMRLLPASNSCSERTWNISERLSRRFRTDPMSLNLIMYNCTNASTTTVSAARRGGELVETAMRCGSESSEFVRIGGSYNASESYEGYYMEGCISSYACRWSRAVHGAASPARLNPYIGRPLSEEKTWWASATRSLPPPRRSTGLGLPRCDAAVLSSSCRDGAPRHGRRRSAAPSAPSLHSASPLSSRAAATPPLCPPLAAPLHGHCPPPHVLTSSASGTSILPRERTTLTPSFEQQTCGELPAAGEVRGDPQPHASGEVHGELPKKICKKKCGQARGVQKFTSDSRIEQRDGNVVTTSRPSSKKSMKKAIISEGSSLCRNDAWRAGFFFPVLRATKPAKSMPTSCSSKFPCDAYCATEHFYFGIL